jgi:DNA-binding MarR family transcriptional regulator
VSARPAPPTPAPAVDATPPPAALELERFLPYRLSVLSNRISGAIAREYSQRFALGVTEWRVMAVLGRYPDLSAGEVAQRTAMDKVAVSRAVASLLDAGRIERDVHDGDRRRSVLRLSPAGHAIYDEVAPLALAFERNLLGDMAAAERALLFRLLDRLDELELRAEAEAPP